jgi:hypothetical protein
MLILSVVWLRMIQVFCSALADFLIQIIKKDVKQKSDFQVILIKAHLVKYSN